MSSLNDHDEEVIEIVEPLVSQSIQNPSDPQNNSSQQDKIIEEEHTQKTQTQTKPSKQNYPHESKVSDRKRKKIILYKCKVCKTTGKKSTVKMCSKCKFHFHIQCLDPQKILDESKTFICQICEKYPSNNLTITKRSNNSQTNFEKDDDKFTQNTNQQRQRSTNGFLNISRLSSIYQANFKKQEWKRKLYQFYKKYPYCFQKNKIIFPIEDHLLHIYQSILPSYCKTTTPRPLPHFPNDGVPEKYYNQLMEIQAFFHHFWQDLKLYNFFRPQNKKQGKQIKVEQITRKNLYEKLIPQGISQLYAWILETLLRMYLNDIMDRNRIDNIKFIGLSPFFNLLSIINEDDKGLSKQFIIKLAPEIIKNLIKTPSFRHSFYCDYQTEQHHQLQYPKNLSCLNKIKLLTKLIHGLCDTDCFKEIVIKKSQQISILTKQKGQNLQKLKQIENENIPLRENIKQLEAQLKQLAFSDPKEYSKKYEPNNKKLQKLIIKHKQNLEKIEEYREKVKKGARKMPFVNSAVKFLGVDRFKSEYFFYKNDKSRIYVKYRESLLGEESSEGYLCYSTREEVEKLKSWLNGKGANEKGLLFNINSLEQKDLLVFSQNDIKQNHTSSISELNPINIEQQKRLYQLESVTRQQNLQTLIFCENLYKQTLQNNQLLLQRQKEMQQIFQKLQSTNQHSIKQIIKPQRSQLSQHPLKTLFSKYTSKLLHWNQKAKKFWYQFLDTYTNQPNQQTQGNLFIITTIWKISMTLFYNQFIRKKQKIQKKKEKFNQTVKQREINNFILRDSQIEQQQTSSNQPESTPFSPQENITRKLRKRQNRNKIQQKQDTSPEQSFNPSTKKQISSNQSQQITQQVNSDKKLKNKPKSNQQKASLNQKKNTKNKNKKKLSIESQTPSSSQKTDQKQQKQVLSSQNSVKESNQLLLQFQEQQVSPEQEFCEECFENLNYDKASKIKIVHCEMCSKGYHKKCLNEDDSQRLKKFPNTWKCDDCSQKLKTQKVTNKKGKIQNINDRNIINQQTIIPQTDKVKAKNGRQIPKNIKPSKIVDLKQTTKKSKIEQKVEKKQRKRKQQDKKSNSQEINSQSLEKSQLEPKKIKSTKRKTITERKQIDKNLKRSNQQNNQGSKRSRSKIQLQKSVNDSKQLKEGRLTRGRNNRKKIIEPQSQEQQPNSEEQEYIQEQLI